MAMLVNIASMPMKAYFSEHPPWSVPNQVSVASLILPFYGNTKNYTAMIDFPNFHPILTMEITMHKSCIMLPICQLRLMFSFMVANSRFSIQFCCSHNDMNWNNRGVCVQISYFSASIGFQCVRVTRGNLLANICLPHEFTITAIRTISANKTWFIAKFCYQMCVTIYVCYLMWTRHYRHCINLEHYEVAWGNPTPIILMNPYMTLAFFLDCWFSAETISISDNIYIILSAFMYLCRTLQLLVIQWSWTMGNVGFLLKIYFFLFDCILPSKYDHRQIDGGPPS
ncbi:hypothetical protein THRCLA_00339 [Thraustotheca clavata]|uniref:Transmembrane protein n=1 Tax=Thraustotheca clavata TaxID=74557 RepID=A0A1W0ABL3_9STRA|nr:hypothetical protein THRCLA_00339 [Thraustotheca clavata]